MSLLATGVFAVAAFWFQGHPGGSATQTDSPEARSAPGVATPANDDALPAFLPVEARQTLALIARGGPFPHPQDGGVFGNYERHLPAQARGWYHEYTVETPGLSHRGTRRIITGGTPPRAYWYTDDHYASFHPFKVPRP